MIQYSSINDAWGNKEIYKKNALNNFEGFNNSKPVEKFVSQKNTPVNDIHIAPIIEKPIIVQNIAQNKEHFEPAPINPAADTATYINNYTSKSCSFAEHLKNCEHCRNSLTEYFENDSSVSTINIFGLKINITKDVLKVIFIILIVLIFIIILSTINFSLNNSRMNMKYYMVPQVPHNLPYY